MSLKHQSKKSNIKHFKKLNFDLSGFSHKLVILRFGNY